MVATLTPQRTPADCSYITSPGRAVRALVTDLGVLEKLGDLASSELVLTAVPAGDAPIADRVAAARAACGWELASRAARSPSSRRPPPEEVEALRRWDPRGWFLRGALGSPGDGSRAAPVEPGSSCGCDHTGPFGFVTAEQARQFDELGYFVVEDAFDA